MREVLRGGVREVSRKRQTISLLDGCGEGGGRVASLETHTKFDY